MERRPLIVLTGPTAVGKTALSIHLAQAVGGEIISADSMQVYRGMDIGSAKIRTEEMQGVRHHLIDVLDPEEEFHVVRFQELAKAAMEEIWNRGHIPILTGGTGFYIQAVLYDIDFTESGCDDGYRGYLEELAREKGDPYLHDLLRAVDPASAESIHANNRKRVIRALEYFHETGEAISAHNEEERARTSPYSFVYFVLTDDRERLYQRIDRRVDQMLEDGLIREVTCLKGKGYDRSLISMQGLGYKELLAYLEGEISLEEAVRIIKRDTRHFAKRQLTWFRREREVTWIDRRDYADERAILDFMLACLQEKGILPPGAGNATLGEKKDE